MHPMVRGQTIYTFSTYKNNPGSTKFKLILRFYQVFVTVTQAASITNICTFSVVETKITQSSMTHGN